MMREERSATGALLHRAQERTAPEWHADQAVRICGTGSFARSIAEALIATGYRIECFIQTAPTSETFLGYPVRSWAYDLSNHSVPLVIGVFNRITPTHEITSLARAHGYADLRYPWDVCERFGTGLGQHFWLSPRRTILDHAISLESLYERLADEESRDCLLRTLAFRLGLDDEYGAFRHTSHQYFNELTLREGGDEGLVYVDGGAYSGDSLDHLIARSKVKRAYLFEPDRDNFEQLAARTAQNGWPAINLPLALLDRYALLEFNAGLGEGSFIGAGSGGTQVMGCSLDMMLPEEKVDLIKFDIEGAEIPALVGASALIRRARPVMAISLYHRPDDLWRIPETIDAICPDYRFYIRQYGANTLESVLYALPERGE